MGAEELIQCQNCGRSVVPRLLLSGGDFLTYMTTQHLCPYCGVVMYETGGTHKRVPVVITAVVLCLALIALLILVLKYLNR